MAVEATGLVEGLVKVPLAGSPGNLSEAAERCLRERGSKAPNPGTSVRGSRENKLVHLKGRLSNPVEVQILTELATIVDNALANPAEIPPKPPRRRLHKLSEAQVEELVAAYLGGATITSLATQFNVNRTTVMAVLDRRRTPRRHQGRVLTDAEVQQALQLYRNGLGLRAVGVKLGADYRVVRRALMDAGMRV